MKLKKGMVGLLLTLGAVLSPAMGADYGLPGDIQKGNILHCFNWPPSMVKAELENIAKAGFGSVQLSPLQRPDVKKSGTSWHDLYRPYDLAFKSSDFCSEQELADLCAEAEKYGIKVIVDVVANHVDKTAGYHDTWWDSNDRVRWNGGINYGDRYSITHGQLGDYGDVNSELSDVYSRGKAYVEKLKSLGVKGIRWDAAKHIGLPSESCGFWTAVTSVAGMYHYGEILDAPGPNASIIKEYANYMSVTDNRYSNGAAKDNGGIISGYAGDFVVNQKVSDTKMVYWAESHDTYSNEEWSQNVDQSVIDRAYACMACRNNATALYLSRPTTKGFGNIKTGKGSEAYKNSHVAEVNKFRNAMSGKADYVESDGNVFSCTRQNGGAVIVMKGSGKVSAKNGGNYCPAGTYKDRISGNTFTVTSSTISGTVGSTGIAVIYNDENGGDNGDDNGDDNPTSITIPGDYNLAYSGSLTNVYYWGDGVTAPTWPGEAMSTATGSDGKTYKVFKLPKGTAHLIFNTNGDSDKTGDLDYSAGYVFDNNGPTSLAVTFPDYKEDNGDDNGDDTDLSDVYVYFNNTSNWSKVYVWAWDTTNNDKQCSNASEYPGEQLTEKTAEGYYIWKATNGVPNKIIFTDNGKGKIEKDYKNHMVYDCAGNTSEYVPNGGGSGDDNGDDNGDVNFDSKRVVFYDNSNTNWTTPCIYVWKNENGNDTNLNGNWPGKAMTKYVGNVYMYELPEGANRMVFNNNNKNKQSEDIANIVNHHVYQLPSFGNDDNKKTASDKGAYHPGVPKKVYLMGHVDENPDNHWNAQFGIEMEKNGAKFTAKNVTFYEPATRAANNPSFSFVTALDTNSSQNWAGVNGGHRFGAAEENASIGEAAGQDVKIYAPNVNASSAYSWSIAPGKYDITLDFSTYEPTLGVAKAISTGVDTLEEMESGEAVYFDLMGRRVENPKKGIYIVVKNGSARKVIL